VAQRLSERMSRDDSISAAEYVEAVEALEVENQKLKDDLKAQEEMYVIACRKILDEKCLRADVTNRAEKAEAEVKKLKELEEETYGYLDMDHAELGNLKDRLERVKKLVAEEWDSSTCIVDSEKIEEYEHCTCAEDYANIFVKRLKVMLK
jgi:hypothetical protein